MADQTTDKKDLKQEPKAAETQVVDPSKLEGEKPEDKKQEPVSLGHAIRQPDVEPQKPELLKGGEMVRAVYGRMVDPITLQEYQQGSWKEVEKPSTWLDAQVQAKKLEVRA